MNPVLNNAAVRNDLLGADVNSRVPVKTLSQQDFLKILVTQITSQNPLQPDADLTSITQMAQFTALEQMRQLQSELQRLADAQQRMRAAELLGRRVTLQAPGAAEPIRGLVEAVEFGPTGPLLVVQGQRYSLDQILFVTPSIQEQP
ncbi:MAG: flagellar hook capping FlgD N-terminal domain-containing protein [Verrucomicrobiota bacterium]|nr:hypothetical protein [Limisphaera sp.]MDW8381038.1 flagellar hook capping FlgD N-terminal domain-containing protein [Verrucomicrobiota bacterium]